MASEDNRNHSSTPDFILHSAEHSHKCVFTWKQSIGKAGSLSLPPAENSLLLPAEAFDFQAMFKSHVVYVYVQSYLN